VLTAMSAAERASVRSAASATSPYADLERKAGLHAIADLYARHARPAMSVHRLVRSWACRNPTTELRG
jgi:hypothetical protein